MSEKQSVKVSIMQREFTVACSPEESRGVVEAAAYLDRQMRAVSKGAQVLSIDRCAIMAGLNISHELLTLRESLDDNEQLNARLERLHTQVDQAVNGMQADD
ncbi:MAG: cell division protein ZapA [Gammaproteobacteria bacterium]|nr:cell division protein ZapA [Gammaproteobacteria bacterium]MDD9884872.1 cell division protein ZapA [Gammaproteobacteria bacterium]